MDPNWSDDDESQDGDDYFKEGRQEAIIFLIDSFLYRDEEQSKNCLELIRDAFLNGLLTKDKDLLGVTFTNTKYSPEPKDTEALKNIPVPNNCAVFLPPRQLSKEIVDYYLKFIRSDNYWDFEEKYGVEEGNFTKTLNLCLNMFKQCSSNLGNSTIIYFTQKETPHPENSREYQQAIQKAADLQATDVDFMIIPMCPDANVNFNYALFYKEFICLVRNIEPDECDLFRDVEEEKEMIRDRQTRQNCRKRCNFYLRWKLGSDDLQISVGIYNYYKKIYFPKTVKLHRHDNSVIDVKRVRKIGVIDPETNQLTEETYCKPGDERKSITIGGKKITFTSDELSKLRSPLTPGLTLLGFKPRNVISIHDFVKSPSFLYPDEKTVSGSTKLFRALWEKCIEKEKVAICVLIVRRKTVPHYVALVPTSKPAPNCDDTVNSDSNQNHMINDGFRIVYLPFEIDYRNVNLENIMYRTEVPQSGIDIFQKVTKKLRVKFSPRLFKDPSLKILQEKIAALAFDIEKEEDSSIELADPAAQDNRIQSFIKEIKETFGEDPEQLPGQKRKANNENGEGNKAKTPKIQDENPTREQVESLIQTNTLNSLTVKQLRNYLQNIGVQVSASSKKDALLQKVLELDQ